MIESWYNIPLFDAAYKETYTNLEGAALKTLVKTALTHRKTIDSFTKTGTPTISQEAFVETMVALGGHLIFRSAGFNIDEFKFGNLAFVWNDTFVDVIAYANKTIQIDAFTINKELKQKLKDVFEKSVIVETKGKVYTFITDGQSLKLSRMAKVAGLPLVRENYSEQVIKDYDHIIRDVVSSDPCGRLSILDGVPGTGKTHLIRGMIHEVTDALWVLIPATMIVDMTKPEFIPVLSDTKSAWPKDMPFIFVLEDADSCLVPRGTDNMSAISNILNFADGIFGNLFDIRIIATTNAKVVQIDPAIKRAGRLCRRVDVGTLNNKEANSALDNILKDYKHSYDVLDQKAYTLAEVYQIARSIKDKTKTVEEQPKRRVGF